MSLSVRFVGVVGGNCVSDNVSTVSLLSTVFILPEVSCL